MSRRPRRNRPPLLDAAPDAPDPDHRSTRAPRVPSFRRQLLVAHVTGPHQRLGRDAIRRRIRALTVGDPAARLGCDGLDDCTPDEIRDALRASHGWDPAATVAIDPDVTVAAVRAAGARFHEAVRAGARVAVATSRPASLLGVAQTVAQHVAAAGAPLRTASVAALEGTGRALWWIGGVAVVTDGQALVADDAVLTGDEWLFAVGRPDLVVADRGFAGAAIRAGVDVIAWADLDAPALALAAARGRPVLVVPLDEQRPAAAYEPVGAAITAAPAPAPAAPAPLAVSGAPGGGNDSLG